MFHSAITLFVYLTTVVRIHQSVGEPSCVSSVFTPCACKKRETTKKVLTEGGQHQVEIKYNEYICDIQKNKKHSAAWYQKDGLQCQQITSSIMMYRSASGEQIEGQKITYNTKCELRCAALSCGRDQRKVEKEDASGKMSLDQFCKSGAILNDPRKAFCKLVVSFLR